MSDNCCKDFKGWCRSFTASERLLTILEAILLLLFIALLVFVILHLIACSTTYIEPPTPRPSPSTTDTTADTATTTPDTHTTFDHKEKCTWKPSAKTTAGTRYFENTTTDYTTRSTEEINGLDDDVVIILNQLDDVEVDVSYKNSTMALVKVRPSRDATFGCVLSVVSAHWAVTAASCVEAVEEVDALDSYVMLEDYDGSGGRRSHAVVDVRVHPRYRGRDGVDLSYDLAALRSEDRLPPTTLRLAAPVDHATLTVGETLTVLGYGSLRATGGAAGGRRLRGARVMVRGAGACAGGWAARHLRGGAAVRRAGCGRAAVCAGAAARGAPCSYCAGTPLLRGRTLLAIMADDPQCGVSCEPSLYVNLADSADWLLDVARED